MENDFYAILGVDKDADTAAIRQAFKRMALMHHPDKVPESERPEAEIRFKMISEAYETLGNDELRMLYDAQTQFSASGWQDFYADQTAPDDFFNGNWFDMGADFVPPNTGFRAGPTSGRNMGRTEDAVVEIELELEDVYRGKMLKLSSQRQVLCRRCNATGGRPKASKRMCGSCRGSGSTKKTRMVAPGLVATETVPCPVCRGEGQVFRNKDLCKRCQGSKVQDIKTLIEVYVPKGVKNHHRIVVENQADEVPGKATGDLIIEIAVNAAHSRFRRLGADLYTTAQVSLKEALTGFSRVLVTHLDGRSLKTTVARGEILKPGDILRIPGEGLIVEDRNGEQSVGNLYIEMDIVFPDAIDEHILDRLASLMSDEDEGERSDDTLAESANTKRNCANAELGVGIDVEHDVINETELPAYDETANDENASYSHTSNKTSEGAAFDDRWYTHNKATAGSAPGCATM